jgi:hypothetical protein
MGQLDSTCRAPPRTFTAFVTALTVAVQVEFERTKALETSFPLDRFKG